MVKPLLPKRLNAGDSASWVASFADYPASQGWDLRYSLTNGSNVFSVATKALGDDYEVVIGSSLSSTFSPGQYSLIGYVMKDDERYIVSTSDLEVMPDVTVKADRRSQAERTLQAINDLLEGKADDDQQMIQYAGRTLSRYTFEQLEAIRSRLARTVAREKDRKAGRKGSIGVKLR